MIEILRQRRSIRRYQDKPVEPEKIDILKEAALRSPSSRNINPWQFAFVTDTDIIKKLSVCKKHGSVFMMKAALAVVVLGDSDKSDVWVEDCSIASILLQLTAQSLNLGSCWIQVRNRLTAEESSSSDYIKHLIGADDNMQVESIIAIGYPAEQRTPLGYHELDYSKVHDNKF